MVVDGVLLVVALGAVLSLVPVVFELELLLELELGTPALLLWLAGGVVGVHFGSFLIACTTWPLSWRFSQKLTWLVWMII